MPIQFFKKYVVYHRPLADVIDNSIVLHQSLSLLGHFMFKILFVI